MRSGGVFGVSARPRANHVVRSTAVDDDVSGRRARRTQRRDHRRSRPYWPEAECMILPGRPGPRVSWRAARPGEPGVAREPGLADVVDAPAADDHESSEREVAHDAATADAIACRRSRHCGHDGCDRASPPRLLGRPAHAPSATSGPRASARPCEHRRDDVGDAGFFASLPTVDILGFLVSPLKSSGEVTVTPLASMSSTEMLVERVTERDDLAELGADALGGAWP